MKHMPSAQGKSAGIVAALLLGLSTSAAAQQAGGLSDFLKDSSKSFVLENARLIDGSGNAARDNVTIVVENGRITHIGAAPHRGPTSASRIDLAGHTILPGLVMMHEHINYFSGHYVWDSHPGSVPKLLLAAGVTTARTAGSEAPQVDLNLKARIDAGKAVGPRLFVTGPYLNGVEGGFLGDNPVTTAEEARSITAFWADRGATSVKVYSAISPDALRGAVEEANRRKIHVAGHLGEISCADAANSGIHTIEHSLSSCVKDFGIAPDGIGSFRYADSADHAARLIKLLVSRGVTIVSTAGVDDLREPSAEELAMFNADQRARYEQTKKDRPPWMPPLAAMPAWIAAHRAFEQDFVKAGGRLLIGGDASDFGLVPGYTNHTAIIALVNSGFSPLQVFKFATSDAAMFLGIGSQRGTVREGMAADLLVVKGAPDRNIEDIRNAVYVFKDGAAYDPVKLRAAAKGLLGQH